MLKTICIACFSSFILLVGLPSVGHAQSSQFPTYDVSETEVPTPPGKTPNLFPQEGAVSLQDTTATSSSPFPLTLSGLESKLLELGIAATRNGNQLDLAYQAELDEQDVEVFFSLILSQQQPILRIRAWLDPLPAKQIPEEHLLELLAANANMESGLNYGYSKSMKRFLLEKVVPNQSISSIELDDQMRLISEEVANTWMLWSTTEWTAGPKRASNPSEFNPEDHTLLHDKFEMPLRR